MTQRKLGPVQQMVTLSLGASAVAAFNLWAIPRHLYTPIIVGVPAIITGTIGIITGAVASIVAKLNAKIFSCWAAVAYIIWWVIQFPGNALHLMANVGVFLSTACYCTATLLSSI